MRYRANLAARFAGLLGNTPACALDGEPAPDPRWSTFRPISAPTIRTPSCATRITPLRAATMSIRSSGRFSATRSLIWRSEPRSRSPPSPRNRQRSARSDLGDATTLVTGRRERTGRRGGYGTPCGGGSLASVVGGTRAAANRASRSPWSRSDPRHRPGARTVASVRAIATGRPTPAARRRFAPAPGGGIRAAKASGESGPPGLLPKSSIA